MPYGSSQIIQKIECKNHILRNYCGKLREIAQRRIENVSVQQRNLIRQRLLRLRFAVAKAIEYRARQDTPIHVRTEELRRDILNGPFHVFGDHEKCADRGYFCNGAKDGEINLVPELKACGLHGLIMSALHRVAHHAPSLVYNVNNNSAEMFNSFVAKFVGGKRVNFSKRDSYQTRCQAAVVAMNSKGQLHRMMHKTIVDRSPGVFTKRYVNKRSKNIDQACKRRLLYPDIPKAKKVRQTVAGPDADYGSEASAPDMDIQQFEREQANVVLSLHKTDEERGNIQMHTMGQGNSALWMQERSQRLTASSFGRICKMRSTTSCGNTVKCLLYSGPICTAAMKYGIEREPFALQQLQEEYGIVVEPCGLFIDKHQCYLGATPDGLIGCDGLVEVKCPAVAEHMTPLQAVAEKKVNFCNIHEGKMQLKCDHTYMYQIQGQLHITLRSYCYFVFWTPCGMLVQKITRDDLFWELKMEKKLQEFYFKCLLPELVDPRYKRGLEIRDPPHILLAQAKKRKC